MGCTNDECTHELAVTLHAHLLGGFSYCCYKLCLKCIAFIQDCFHNYRTLSKRTDNIVWSGYKLKCCGCGTMSGGVWHGVCGMVCEVREGRGVI